MGEMMTTKHAHFETYFVGDAHRWRLRAANGRIVSSGEAFVSGGNVDRAIAAAIRAAEDAATQPIRRVKS